MLPRTKSIFHLDAGEEAAATAAAAVNETCTAGVPIRSSSSWSRAPAAAESLLVGLRILIVQQQQQHHLGRAPCNVVMKPVLRRSTTASSSGAQQNKYSYAAAEDPSTMLGFLKACHLCKTALSPHKDVYMYRGDQGFCSIECRCKQILLDERRELEASARDRFGMPQHHRGSVKVAGQSNRRRRVSVAA